MRVALDSVCYTEVSKPSILFGCIPRLKIRSRIQKLFHKNYDPFHALKECAILDLTTRQFNIEPVNNSIQPVGILNSSRNC